MNCSVYHNTKEVWIVDHIEEIKKIFAAAIEKGHLSTALRAKMLEVKLMKTQVKNLKELSEQEINEMIKEIDTMLEE